MFFRFSQAFLNFSPSSSLTIHSLVARMCSPKEASNCSQFGCATNSCTLKIGVQASSIIFTLPLSAPFSLSSSCACLATHLLLEYPSKRLATTLCGTAGLLLTLHHNPWHNTQSVGLMIVAVKLSDEILNLPCQFEQFASSMVLCTLMGNGSCCSSPLYFSMTCPRPDCSFLIARHLGTLVQTGFSTITPKLAESLYVMLIHCVGPRGVLFCQDVCQNTLRLWLRVTEMKFKSMFLMRAIVVTVCSYFDNSNRAATRTCVGMPVAPTRPTSQSECLTIRFASTASILLPGPRQWPIRTAKKRCGITLRSTRIMICTLQHHSR